MDFVTKPGEDGFRKLTHRGVVLDQEDFSGFVGAPWSGFGSLWKRGFHSARKVNVDAGGGLFPGVDKKKAFVLFDDRPRRDDTPVFIKIARLKFVRLRKEAHRHAHIAASR